MFGFIIPFIVVIVFYKMITTRLGQIAARLNKNKKKSSKMEAPKQLLSFLTIFSTKNRITTTNDTNQVNDSYSLAPAETFHCEGAPTDYPEPTGAECNFTSTEGMQKTKSQVKFEAIKKAEYIRQVNENNREKRLTKQFFQINLCVIEF